MDADEKRRTLAGIAKRVASCTECGLCRGRTNSVPGEGNADADIVFVGEGPGFHEDKQGRPFVGAAGKFLDELLVANGMSRKSVFITNIVKCRPPENRDPQPDEIAACDQYLEEQLAAIQPKVVVTLGRHSMQRYFPGESIGRVHGQPRRKGEVIVVPMYHPAAALHQASLRRVIEADFAKLPQFLRKQLAGDDAPASERRAPVPAHLRREPGEQQDGRNGGGDAAASPAPAGEAEAQQMRLL